MGAALATGCTIVLKPAEQTPLSLLYTAKLFKKQVFQRCCKLCCQVSALKRGCNCKPS
ncbi:aldehyde dehydrogenase family protein [Bacillus pacificus]